mgnify:CR=1 FL=1
MRLETWRQLIEITEADICVAATQKPDNDGVSLPLALAHIWVNYWVSDTTTKWQMVQNNVCVYVYVSVTVAAFRLIEPPLIFTNIFSIVTP